MYVYFVEFNIFICLAKLEAKQMIYQVKRLNQILVELNKMLHKLKNTYFTWITEFSSTLLNSAPHLSHLSLRSVFCHVD